jgi:Uma2 family endonuclease
MEDYVLEEFNYDKYKNMEDDNRYEIIEGRLYNFAPSPSIFHQHVCGNIYHKLRIFLQGKECIPFISPVDVILAPKGAEDKDIKNVVQPDVFVICNKSKIDQKGIIGAPEFVVEVVSPNTSARDYLIKLKLYEKYGTKEYWIVNPQEKSVAVFTQAEEGGFDRGRIFFHPAVVKSLALPGFEMSTEEIFSNI